MFNRKIFSERLSEQRKSRGLTMQELGEYLKISPQAVSSMERGLSSPSADVLAGLADIFPVSIDYLVGISESTGIVEKMMISMAGKYAENAPEGWHFYSFINDVIDNAGKLFESYVFLAGTYENKSKFNNTDVVLISETITSANLDYLKETEDALKQLFIRMFRVDKLDKIETFMEIDPNA